MDLVAEMFLLTCRAHHAAAVQATQVRPEMARRWRRLPFLGGRPAAFNADRLWNRLWDYPRRLRRSRDAWDLFHICDHSYAHLVHALPRRRTGVFCHDLDLFRCLLEPGRERRPFWFRRMAGNVMRGLQKAEVVFYSTAAVRRQIERHGLLDPSRLVHAPYGISPEFTPTCATAAPANDLFVVPRGTPFLLHVGSCIPRKRVDVLLETFARVRRACPGLRLVQIGGQWTASQRGQIVGLGIGSAVTQHRGLDRHTVASLYRRAALVLIPSEAEGFGLPVIEGLACGGTVVASDIPALREVGGEAAVYCPPADVPAWVETVTRLLARPSSAPARPVRLGQARRFSWAEHARTILEAYRKLA
jgi:glycosyltransferase involved in cell wall biosynthesis